MQRKTMANAETTRTNIDTLSSATQTARRKQADSFGGRSCLPKTHRRHSDVQQTRAFTPPLAKSSCATRFLGPEGDARPALSQQLQDLPPTQRHIITQDSRSYSRCRTCWIDGRSPDAHTEITDTSDRSNGPNESCGLRPARREGAAGEELCSWRSAHELSSREPASAQGLGRVAAGKECHDYNPRMARRMSSRRREWQPLAR